MPSGSLVVIVSIVACPFPNVRGGQAATNKYERPANKMRKGTPP